MDELTQDCERLLVALHRAHMPMTRQMLASWTGGRVYWQPPEVRLSAALDRLVSLGLVRLSRERRSSHHFRQWRYAAVRWNGGRPIADPLREEWHRTTKTARASWRRRAGGLGETTL